tara:strand:- start:2126 stop:2608 length:483 start_codon:yes stop_codon:yes gene_type:complete
MTADLNINWEIEVLKVIKKLKGDFSSKVQISAVPVGKISDFSMEQVIPILTFLETDPRSEIAIAWLEKIRRFIEVNRPKLLSVGNQRFGGARRARYVLEAMATLMAVASLLTKQIIYYNATCTVFDALNKVSKGTPWHSESSSKLVENIVFNPRYFVCEI